MSDLTQISDALQALFVDDAHKLARRTKLVQRESKLNAPLILLIFVTGFIQHPRASLNTLAQVADDLGVTITRQALHERLTAAAICFFQLILQRALQRWQNHTAISVSLLDQFSEVALLDSTQITLPDQLQAEYPAAGGDGPKAGLKWQVIYEMLYGKLKSVCQTPATQPDQNYRDFIATLKQGALLLFDLGYVSLWLLQQLLAEGIYFICRYYTRLALYNSGTAQRLDLVAELQRCEREGRQQIELEVLVGAQQRLPLRLVGQRLEQRLLEKRLRAANQRARKHGRQYSAEYKALLRWSLYLTNTSAAQLNEEQVLEVYRLRWQIELVFKLWKSAGALAQVTGKQSARVLCELYAKMIGLVLYAYLSATQRYGQRELSASRSWLTLQLMMEKLALGLIARQDLGELLARLFARWQRHGSKDEYKSRPSTLRRLDMRGAARPV